MAYERVKITYRISDNEELVVDIYLCPNCSDGMAFRSRVLLY